MKEQHTSAWLERRQKAIYFLIYIKLLYLPVLQLKKKQTMNYRFTWQRCTCKASALIWWEMMQSCLMQVESSSLLKKSFKYRASHGQENELSHAATFPPMPASGVKCLIHKKIDSSCSEQISFPTDDPQLSSSVGKTAQAQQQSCYPMTIPLFGSRD